MIEFKGSHFEREVILWGVRWYVAYPISYRQLEEMMDERGVEVDHSTLNRAWFEIGSFWVTRTCGNHRLTRPDAVRSLYEPTEAASLPDSRPVRLERSEPQESEPMCMAFTCHHFAGTFAFALRALTAHEAPVVQKATQQIQIRTTQVAA
jgi:hypothetical protein